MTIPIRRTVVLFVITASILSLFTLFFTDGLSFFTYHSLSGLTAIKHQIALCFKNGEYPLWNAYMLSGAPFHSGIGILDPFLISYALLDGIPALLGSAFLALWFAAVTMYLYLRRCWHLDWPAALLGALCYGANPFFAATCHETPFMNPPVFLPLIFLFYETGRARAQAWRLVLSGIFLGFAFLSGNFESFYFVALFFGTIGLLRLIPQAMEAKSWQLLKKGALSLLFVLLFAIGFAAFDLLPSFAMILISGRGANATVLQNLIYFVMCAAAALLAVQLWDRFVLAAGLWKRRGFVVLGGIAILFMIRIHWSAQYVDANTNLFYPLLQQMMIHGRESFHVIWQAFGVQREALTALIEPRYIFYIQPPIYLWTLSSLFLFLAAFRSDLAEIRCFAFFNFFFVLFPYTFLPNMNHYLLHLDVIVYNRIMFGFFFLHAIIMAVVTQRLWQAEGEMEPPSLRLWYRGCGILVLIFSIWTASLLLTPFKPEAFTAMLDLFSGMQGAWLEKTFLGWQLMRAMLAVLLQQCAFVLLVQVLHFVTFLALLLAWGTNKQLWKRLFIAGFVLQLLLDWNLYAFQKKDIGYVLNETVESKFLSQLSPNDRVGTVHEFVIATRTFYDEPQPLLIHSNMPLFWNAKTIEGAAMNLSPRLFNEFWALESRNTYTPTTIRVASSKIYDLMGLSYLFSRNAIQTLNFRLVQSGDRYQIYKNLNGLPRFYFARTVQQADSATIKEKIRSLDWIPGDVTLVESAIPAAWLNARRITTEKAQIEVLKETYNGLQLRTQASSSEFLAMTDAFHGYWKVYVDGRKQKVVKTNFYFRGVFLDSGQHTVVFRYVDPFHRLGLVLTAAFLIFLTVVFFLNPLPLRRLLFDV